jgi:hypothetical protein
VNLSRRIPALPEPFDQLLPLDPDLARQAASAAGSGTPVDTARLALAVRRAAVDDRYRDWLKDQVTRFGSAAGLHPSGRRDLPGERLANHNLITGEVQLGTVVQDQRNSPSLARGPFGISQDVLRTSMLVVAPPGSGKTRSVASPIVEHLSLAALAGTASVVVVDVKGDDFAHEGWFDLTIDPLDPGLSVGLSLFGGSPTAEEAADRLASALLPPKVSDDKAYFMDAAKNAMYLVLGPYHAAYGRWPLVTQLIGLLRGKQPVLDPLRAELKRKGGKGEYAWALDMLDRRQDQLNARVDPAANLLERLTLLDRPMFHRLFDAPTVFTMNQINAPVRVRFVLPEAQMPDAARVMARLIVSQFAQVASSRHANRAIFKGLVIDEAGRYIDEYTALSIQRVRSNNAGLVLLTQSLGDFPRELERTILGSVGCKIVFGGLDPDDAEKFSRIFGEDTYLESQMNVGQSTSRRLDERGRSQGESVSDSRSVSLRQVTRARWSSSDISTRLGQGQMLAAVASSNGHRVGPLLVNARYMA